MNAPTLFDTPREIAFREFHAANPHVYDLFCRLADEVIASGRKRSSARLIIGEIRWRWHIDTRSDDGFKINDHHSPFYARLWLEEHPQHAGFFQTRGDS